MQSLPLRHSHSADRPAQRVVLGLVVIAVGAMALLDRQQLFGLPLLRTFWPLALVLLGLSRLAWPARAGGGLVAAALVVAGSLLTARNLGYTGFSLRDWWPAFIVLAGLSIVLRGLFPRRAPKPAASIRR